ncbi:hypothetical protein [Klebsiella pneumoniae IS46]|nr:hypothetical protein CSC13_3297 [Klebsiella pneumoniae]QBF20764.1 Hypothetical protein KpB31_2233 [Klebsiella pneumoniae]BBE55412.1 hypothetical protein TRKP33_1991 [Klebsiella pneumoniae]CDL13856.1 hypothetical protein [Klebsiella pneumoniae IS46]
MYKNLSSAVFINVIALQHILCYVAQTQDSFPSLFSGYLSKPCYIFNQE